jgi:hypothetical protein
MTVRRDSAYQKKFIAIQLRPGKLGRSMLRPYKSEKG